MGSYVCKKCDIPASSPCIFDNNTRYHCRYHNKSQLICSDCDNLNKSGNCRHVFIFRIWCC